MNMKRCYSYISYPRSHQHCLSFLSCQHDGYDVGLFNHQRLIKTWKSGKKQEKRWGGGEEWRLRGRWWWRRRRRRWWVVGSPSQLQICRIHSPKIVTCVEWSPPKTTDIRKRERWKWSQFTNVVVLSLSPFPNVSSALFPSCFFSPFFFFSLLYPSPRSLRLQYQIKTQISIRLCITLHLFQNTKILSNSYNVYIIFYNFSLSVFSTLRLYYDSSYLVLCH